MRKFFNSVQSQQIQLEKDRLRKKLKRRAARAKVEKELYAHLRKEAIASSQIAEHLVSRIQFPTQETLIEHDIESLIEDLKRKE
jgi:hypothetical protein